MLSSVPSIFVEREEEVQVLLEFAQDAFAGKAGVAFIEGEMGIGKTSLVRELLRQIRREYDDQRADRHG